MTLLKPMLVLNVACKPGHTVPGGENQDWQISKCFYFCDLLNAGWKINSFSVV